MRGDPPRGPAQGVPQTGFWACRRRRTTKPCVAEKGILGQDSFPVVRLRVANYMIVLPYKEGSSSTDPLQRAGDAAERQMAHYLHRTFNDDPSVCVLHGLRIEDPDQPEQNGAPGVCQIDHLLLHRWGVFIVESKSVSQEVRVRPDGTGGDEWSRVWKGRESGMASPIRQAKRQAEFLRSILQRHRAELVGKQTLGFRTVTKVMIGTDQRGFKNMPMRLVIAVSDRGRITRMDGWEEPRKPFQVYVTKADLVPDKVAREVKKHRKGARLMAIAPSGQYGLWDMKEKEVLTVAEFLAGRHSEKATPRSSISCQPPKTPARKTPTQKTTRKTPPENPAQQASLSVQPSCKHVGRTRSPHSGGSLATTGGAGSAARTQKCRWRARPATPREATATRSSRSASPALSISAIVQRVGRPN